MSATVEQVLDELEQFGTEQNRKVYVRHGVGDNQFGVSFTNLQTLAKKYQRSQTLAEQLWNTGNHDARLLATMVADPEAVTSALAESWRKSLDNYVITDAFTGLIAKTSLCRKKMERWSKMKAEWTSRAGFGLLAHLAMRDGTIANAFFVEYVDLIEREIHGRRNRTRDAMNSALIAIGIRNGELKRKAIAAAKRIGTVNVDHGDTGCQTPDAIEYIRRVETRKLTEA
jgi:3-methyladenine DNA glycosylase AlkD